MPADDGVYHPLAGDVLDLAAGEIELGRERDGFGFGEFRNHGFPDPRPGFVRGLVEADLVEEAAFEGLVEILGEVGRCDEDAFEVLHLLKDDVLDAVLHLVDGPGGLLLPDAEDGIRLVEEKYRGPVAVPDDLPVVVEQALDVLLALSHEAVLQFRDIGHHEAAPGLPGDLVDGLGLAGAGCPVEEAV